MSFFPPRPLPDLGLSPKARRMRDACEEMRLRLGRDRSSATADSRFGMAGSGWRVYGIAGSPALYCSTLDEVETTLREIGWGSPMP